MHFWVWIIFLAIVVVLLALDLGVFNKEEHEISMKEALKMTLLWIFCALVFNVFIGFAYENNFFNLLLETPDSSITNGYDAALKYLTGYIIEKTLSLDNVFVIAMLFAHFQIPAKYQHKVLFWGILGALVFRGIMIMLGAALVNRFSWLMYIFGILLIISALKMLFGKNEEFDADKSLAVKLIRKIYPVSPTLDGGHFFTKIEGKKAVTPLMIVLLVIEVADVMFAVDSVPAIFSITTDPYIVFTSNIFAILGLRSLYFVIASFMNKFQYIKYSLVVLLLFIGIKMILIHVVHIPIVVSLAIITFIISIGVLASLFCKKTEEKK